MKKLISIILSLALVACMFGMSAMAADDLRQPVGSYKGNADGASIDDGVEDFSSESAKADVTLKLDDAKSRYAVDIVFKGTYTIEVDGLTWDVNKLTYVTNGTTITENPKFTFEVTNYSDKAVDVATSAGELATGVSATFGDVTPGAAGDTDNVAADNKSCTIVGNAGGDATANKATFSATLVPTVSWADTINGLVGRVTNAVSFKLATFTVTITNPNT